MEAAGSYLTPQAGFNGQVRIDHDEVHFLVAVVVLLQDLLQQDTGRAKMAEISASLTISFE